jgi:hypothetical protein
MNCLFDGQLVIAVETLAKRLTFYVGHDVVKEACSFAGVVKRKDVRMVQSRRELDLTQKSFRTESRRKIRMQDLERDESLVLCVLSQVHGGHPTAAKLAIDGVILLKGAADSFEGSVIHHIA